MMNAPMLKRALVLGTLMLFLAVLIGAFGAHGLKSIVTPDKLVTFETGVRYHFYHGFALLILGIFQKIFPHLRMSFSIHAFFSGILLFSFNCYLYALTDLKTFALIVPVGGLLFLMGWAHLCWSVVKLKDS